MPRQSEEKLPSNIEAEQQVIGSVLMNNKAYLVTDFLKREHFFEPIHQQIWQIIQGMIEADNLASPITVKAHLPADQKVGDMSMAQYMASLAAEALPGSMAGGAAAHLVSLWLRRQQIYVCETAVNACMSPDYDRTSSELLATTIADLSDLQTIADRHGGDRSVTMAEALSASLDATALAYQGGKVAGYDTGLGFMNEITGPWLPGQYIIIGAATKMGKSSLAMQCALGIATQAPVLYFSFEMNAALLAGRILSSRTGIGTLRQRRADISEQEYEKLTSAAAGLQGAENLHIYPHRMSIEDIAQKAKWFKKRHGELGAVFVDHLGILGQSKAARGNSDWELAAHASPIMKEMAEDLDCVTIGLSQVLKENPAYGISRAKEEDSMNAKIAACMVKPHAGMLKGPAGNDADHVIMPFRAEANLSKIEPAKDSAGYLIWEDAMREQKGKAQIVLTLSRESQWPKTRNVIWDGPATEFRTIENEAPRFGDGV